MDTYTCVVPEVSGISFGSLSQCSETTGPPNLAFPTFSRCSAVLSEILSRKREMDVVITL